MTHFYRFMYHFDIWYLLLVLYSIRYGKWISPDGLGWPQQIWNPLWLQISAMWFSFILVCLVTNVLGRWKPSKPVYTTFAINMACSKSPSGWCAEVYFFEVDNIENDDVFWARLCTRKENITFLVRDLLLGGDGIFDHHYEIQYRVFHTCGHKDFRCAESKDYVSVTTDKNFTKSFDIALNNADKEKNKCYGIPKAFTWIFSSTTMEFDGIIKQGNMGIVETWSRYRNKHFVIENI